jgi:hypothetical protein
METRRSTADAMNTIATSHAVSSDAAAAVAAQDNADASALLSSSSSSENEAAQATRTTPQHAHAHASAPPCVVCGALVDAALRHCAPWQIARLIADATAREARK